MIVFFNNSIKEVDNLVEKIKVLLWHWSLSRLKIVHVCTTSGVGILGIVF